VTATQEAGEREIMFDRVLLRLRAAAKQRLHLLPSLTTGKGLMLACVGDTAPVEIAPINPLSKDLVKGTFVQATTSYRPAFRSCSRSQGFERVAA
jgi:arylamine N-acetyltransferase